MSIALAAPVLNRPHAGEEKPRIDLGGISDDQYEIIGEALPECRGNKMIDLDGEFTLVTTSRRHDWIADTIHDVIQAVALGFRLPIAIAGAATFRKRDLTGGIEGDKTYDFGEHARIMRGGVEIDQVVQPPPDLAVEVEVTNPADRAMRTWSRLGVPEVWRFRDATGSLIYWHRNADGSYSESEHSLGLPMLTANDVEVQVRRSDDMGYTDWSVELHDWVRDVPVPRQAGGG